MPQVRKGFGFGSYLSDEFNPSFIYPLLETQSKYSRGPES